MRSTDNIYQRSMVTEINNAGMPIVTFVPSCINHTLINYNTDYTIDLRKNRNTEDFTLFNSVGEHNETPYLNDTPRGSSSTSTNSTDGLD